MPRTPPPLPRGEPDHRYRLDACLIARIISLAQLLYRHFPSLGVGNEPPSAADHLGAYSFYLLYLGLPVLMRFPREKAMTYTVVVILAAIVLFMLIGTIANRFMAVPTAAVTVP